MHIGCFIDSYVWHARLTSTPYAAPIDPQCIGAMQLLLQEVAWNEASRGRKRAERAAVTARYKGVGDVQHEPLFCTETALKVGRRMK
jgi:hypothetical protein